MTRYDGCIRMDGSALIKSNDGWMDRHSDLYRIACVGSKLPPPWHRFYSRLICRRIVLPLLAAAAVCRAAVVNDRAWRVDRRKYVLVNFFFVIFTRTVIMEGISLSRKLGCNVFEAPTLMRFFLMWVADSWLLKTSGLIYLVCSSSLGKQPNHF